MSNHIVTNDGEDIDDLFPGLTKMIYPDASMEIEPYDIIEGLYWFAANYHQGQTSPLYSLLSLISKTFKPGMHNGPSTDESKQVYDELVEAEGNGTSESRVEEFMGRVWGVI